MTQKGQKKKKENHEGVRLCGSRRQKIKRERSYIKRNRVNVIIKGKKKYLKKYENPCAFLKPEKAFIISHRALMNFLSPFFILKIKTAYILNYN